MKRLKKLPAKTDLGSDRVIELESFHHVSLPVTDLQKAKHFYGENRGFPEIERPNFDFPGAWYQLGNQQLHLIVYPEAETIRSKDQIDTKETHLAVRVKSYKKTLQKLKNKGVFVKEKPNSKSGFAQIFCMDPDRNLVEFNVEQKDLDL